MHDALHGSLEDDLDVLLAPLSHTVSTCKEEQEIKAKTSKCELERAQKQAGALDDVQLKGNGQPEATHETVETTKGLNAEKCAPCVTEQHACAEELQAPTSKMVPVEVITAPVADNKLLDSDSSMVPKSEPPLPPPCEGYPKIKLADNKLLDSDSSMVPKSDPPLKIKLADNKLLDNDSSMVPKSDPPLPPPCEEYPKRKLEEATH